MAAEEVPRPKSRIPFSTYCRLVVEGQFSMPEQTNMTPEDLMLAIRSLSETAMRCIDCEPGCTGGIYAGVETWQYANGHGDTYLKVDCSEPIGPDGRFKPGNITNMLNLTTLALNLREGERD